MLPESRSPVEGGVNGRQFQDDEPCQLLLGLGEWAILHAPLSFPETHRRPCLGHFKRISDHVDAGLDKRLVVSPPGAEIRDRYRRFSGWQGLQVTRRSAGQNATVFSFGATSLKVSGRYLIRTSALFYVTQPKSNVSVIERTPYAVTQVPCDLCSPSTLKFLKFCRRACRFGQPSFDVVEGDATRSAIAGLFRRRRRHTN
jgi:hypothetical protein